MLKTIFCAAMMFFMLAWLGGSFGFMLANPMCRTSAKVDEFAAYTCLEQMPLALRVPWMVGFNLTHGVE